MSLEIYFSGARRAGQIVNQRLVSDVSSTQQLYNSKLLSRGLSNSALHQQMIEKMEVADAFISVIDSPCLTDGYELCLAEQLDLPNLILYRHKRDLGSLILGSTKLNLVPFRKFSEVRTRINKYVKQFPN